VASIQCSEGCRVGLLLVYSTLVEHTLVVFEEGLVAESSGKLRDDVTLRCLVSVESIVRCKAFANLCGIITVVDIRVLAHNLIQDGQRVIAFGCLRIERVELDNEQGVIKELRARHPLANIVAVDYDPGASEVNQLNRIKLMLATAERNLSK